MTKRKDRTPPSAADDAAAGVGEKIPTSTLELEDVLAQIGADQNLVIYIHKEAGDGSGRMDYVCRVNPGQLDLDAIRRQYGGGKYVLRSRNPQTGRWGLSKTFGLAAPLDPGMAGGGAGGLAADFQQTLLLKLLEQRTAAPSDPMAIAVQLAGLMKPATDPMDVAVKLAGLMREGAGGSSSVDTLLRGMELGKKITNPEAAEGSVWDVIKEMGPPIVGLLGKVAERGAAAAPVAGPEATAGNLPTTAAPAPSLAEAPVITPYLNAIRQLVPKLQQWAAADKDPYARAAVVMEDVPAWVQDIVAREALQPDFQAKIFTAFPELQPIEAWVHEFLNAITEWAQPDPANPAGTDDGSGLED